MVSMTDKLFNEVITDALASLSHSEGDHPSPNDLPRAIACAVLALAIATERAREQTARIAIALEEQNQ